MRKSSMRNNFTRCLTFLVLLLGMWVGALAQQEKLPLVAEIDFSVPGQEGAQMVSLDKVSATGNTIVPITFSTEMKMADSIAFSEESSSFLDNQPCYAITPNPVRLDSFRMMDNEDNGEWGFVVSSGKRGLQQQCVLSCHVEGLKAQGKCRIEVEYCNPHTPSYVDYSPTNPEPHSIAVYAGELMINSGKKPLAAAYEMFSLRSLAAKKCSLSIFETSAYLANLNEKGDLDFHLATNLYTGFALMIKSIRLYADIAPIVYGPKEVCVGSDAVVLSADTIYSNTTIQWYENGRAIKGATDWEYVHVPYPVSPQKETVYSYSLSSSSVEMQSASFQIKEIECCKNDIGQPLPRRLLWQEDFGTFTSDSTYWSWDYSDPDAPKKVMHDDAEKWSTCYGLELSGYSCATSPSYDATYTVAGNVTCSNDVDVSGGTCWSYEAYCFNGETPGRNGRAFAPDHTYQGLDYGGMFFVNGSFTDSVVYSKTIKSSLIPNASLLARGYLNTFIAETTKGEVYMRLTDLKSGTVVKSNVVDGLELVGSDWAEFSIRTNFEGDEILLEIIMRSNTPTGSDFILDDIQLFLCSAENPVKCTKSGEPTIYADGKYVKSIHLKSGESVTLTSSDVTVMDMNGKPYADYIMSWHIDDAESMPISDILGAVARPLTVNWEDADKNGTLFILKVQDNVLDAYGKEINDCNTYDTLIVYADVDPVSGIDSYCLDDYGNKIPMKLVWQEDFGTFTSDKNYWTWDYSDLSNPKKLDHTDGKNWATCIELTPQANVECAESPSLEGRYCVAGNVTCAFDGVEGGTQWGWEAYFGDGKRPIENGWTFIPDHTYDTTAYGGMLFLNCNNESEAPIYTRQVSGLQSGNYTAICYVNTFAGSPYPVDIRIQVKDLTTGDIHKSKHAVKSITSGVDWVAAQVEFYLQGTDMELSVVSCAGDGTDGLLDYNKNGNDLVLDDIQLYMCDDSEHVGVKTQLAGDMDELVNVYTISGVIVKSNVKKSEALDGLKKGSYYIVGHEKVLVEL